MSFDWAKIKEEHEQAYARGQIAALLPARMYSAEELEAIYLDMVLSTVEIDTALKMDFQNMSLEMQRGMLELLKKEDSANVSYWKKTLL